jgi:hypothetical protein
MYTTRNKLEACHVDDPQVIIWLVYLTWTALPRRAIRPG